MKKLLAIVISMAMVLAMLPMGVYADNNHTENCVAEIGEQHYETLQDAISAAQAGETVKLLKNISDVSVKGPADKMITIDLNGCSLTGSITKDHDLTITDSSADKTGTADFTYVQCNVLTLRGGEITINDARINHAVYVNGGNVTINGGEYKLGGTGHPESINVAEDYDTTKLIINAGLFDTNDNLENSNTVVIDRGEGKSLRYVVGKTTKGESNTFSVEKVSTTEGQQTLYFYDLYTGAVALTETNR